MTRTHVLEETHSQCRLIKDLGDSSTKTTVGWIPSKYAKVGLEVAIGDKKSHEWGWIVNGVGGTLPTILVRKLERGYLRHRKFSDI